MAANSNLEQAAELLDGKINTTRGAECLYKYIFELGAEGNIG